MAPRSKKSQPGKRGFTAALPRHLRAQIRLIIAIAVGEWWVLPVALGAHAAGFLIVMALIAGRATEDRDKPGPVAEARLEEEAVERTGPNGSRRSEDEPRVFGH